MDLVPLACEDELRIATEIYNEVGVRTVWALLVESLMRNICVKLFFFFNLFLRCFLFLALVAILFGGAEPFGQFWQNILVKLFLIWTNSLEDVI